MQLTSTRKTIAAWVGIVGCFLLLLWRLSAVLAPFVVAAVLAYAMTPVVDRLDAALRPFKWRLPRVVLVLLTELVFLLLLAGVFLLMVPIVATELPLMRAQLPLLLGHASDLLQPLAAQWGIPLALDRESIQAYVGAWLSANAASGWGTVMASVKLGGSVAFAVVGNVVLVPVVLFYLLNEWHSFIGLVRGLLPVHLRAVCDRFARDADAVLGQYLRGQLLVMALLAVYYSAALWLFRLDLALPIGVFTGLAIFVPYLGFGLGLVLASVAGVLQFSAVGSAATAFVMVSVVYGAGQVLESFVLTPRLVGERIGLHPLAVIFALLAFGQLFGLVGVLVALPVSAVLLVALRRLRAAYLASDLYAD